MCKLLLPEEYFFISIVIKCGLICQSVVRDETTTIIQKDPWISFTSEYELINVEINKYKVDVLVENKMFRRNVSFIRIGNKRYPSYFKASYQYNSGHLPLLINTCHINRIFIQSITINISDSLSLNYCINSNILKMWCSG